MEKQRGHCSGRSNSAAVESKRRRRSTILYAIQNVVNAWAKAYIGKDSNAFTVLVGDPNSEHAYQPAAIGTFKNVSINWLVECDKNGQSVPKEQSSDTPPYAAASISITFEPYAAMRDSSDKGKRNDIFGQNRRFDLQD